MKSLQLSQFLAVLVLAADGLVFTTLPRHVRCPVEDATEAGPSKLDPLALVTLSYGSAVLLPNDDFLATHQLDFDGEMAIPDPHPELRRRSELKVGSVMPRDASSGHGRLVARAGGKRLFASSNYRAVAAQGAILMLDAANTLTAEL